MATRKKTAKPAAKKAKNVRRSIPADAIIYVPGQGLPKQLEELVQQKAGALAEDELRRRSNSDNSGASVMMAPVTVMFVADKSTDLLSNLSHQDRVKAVAIIVDRQRKEFKSHRDAMAQSIDAHNYRLSIAADNSQQLERVISGDFNLIIP